MDEGISSPNYSLLMVDNAGMTELFIPNGSGRSFIDEDGLAEISTWPESEKQISSYIASNMQASVGFGNQ